MKVVRARRSRQNGGKRIRSREESGERAPRRRLLLIVSIFPRPQRRGQEADLFFVHKARRIHSALRRVSREQSPRVPGACSPASIVLTCLVPRRVPDKTLTLFCVTL